MAGYHYTSMLLEEGGVRGLDLHLERLRRDHRAMFGRDLDLDALRERLRAFAAGLDRPVVIRVACGPEPELGNRPRGDLDPIRVRVVSHERRDAATKHEGIVTDNAALREAAIRDGYDDVLFRTGSGFLTEGSTWNVCLELDGELVWPEGPQLTGVGIALLHRALPIRRTPVSQSRLPNITAAAAISSVRFRAVSAIDGRDLPGSEALVARLREAYAAIPPTEL